MTDKVTTENTAEDQISAVPATPPKTDEHVADVADVAAPPDSTDTTAGDVPDTYLTLPGDTWETIADGFGLDADTVFDLNVGTNDVRTRQSLPIGAVIHLRETATPAE